MLGGIMWWHFVAVGGIGLITRILPRLLCNDARGMDTYYHLTAARAIRENGFRIPLRLKEFALPGLYDYPPLYHCLLAMFPVSWHLRVERWSSAVIDALHGCVVFWVSLYFFVETDGLEGAASKAFWVSLVFILSPLLTSVGSGPRAYQGTPRTLGELFLTLSISSTIIHIESGSLLFFILAGFFGGCLLLTSKFAAQVVILLQAVFFIGSQDIRWMLVAALSFAMAWGLSWGHYREVARGHLEHCRYYQKAIMQRFHMLFRKNRLDAIRRLPRDIVHDPRQAAITVLMDNTYLNFVFKNLHVFYLPYVLLAPAFAGGISSYLFLLWVIGALLGFGITSQRRFLFLGEADRYLEYAPFPGLFLIAASGNAFPFFYFLLFYEIVLYVLYVIVFQRQYAEKIKELPKFRELAAYVRSDAKIRCMLPVYLNDAVHLAYESGKGIAHFPGNFRERYFSIEEFGLLYDKVYPFATEKLETVMNRLKFDTVFLSERDLRRAGDFGIQYDFSGWSTLFSNEKYRLVQPKRVCVDDPCRYRGEDKG